jgi:hypothetical protein
MAALRRSEALVRMTRESNDRENKDEDRLFVRDGWRHYRRRYSIVEARWSLVTVAALALAGVWVAWRGAHPDPSLFSDGAALLAAPAKAAAPTLASPEPAPAAVTPAAAADRGPLPRELGGAGWREGAVAEFDADNLYVKINGRAEYFRAFGFRRLHSILLTSEKDPAVTVDVEMYDLGLAANALGAYGGERPPGAKVEVGEAGLHHIDRNAAFLARGRYYVRVIGADESAAVAQKLRAVVDAVLAGVAGEPLPWAYGLLVGGLGIAADKITYFRENAFSLGFARDVWSARPAGKQSDLELFVVALPDAAAAAALAAKLRGAFLELGEAAGKAEGVALVKDRFLGLFSGAGAIERWVYGVRGADGKEGAGKELARLRLAFAEAPAALRERARPAPAAAASVREGDER